jgi:hypothetical protein
MHDPRDRAPSQRGERSAREQKHRPRPALLWTASQIADDRLPNVDGQRQHRESCSFAADLEFAAAPVDVLELDRGDLAGAQSKPCEQQQHGVITTADRSPAITAGQQPRDLRS